MNRSKFPIGIQNFREIRESELYYVDKTGHIDQLVNDAKHVFLSRPRRFGKSLLLDTLKELFEGNENLFHGLAIHDHWDWSVRSPVLYLDFGDGHYSTLDKLEESVQEQLDDIASTLCVSTTARSSQGRLRQIIRAAEEASGERVVVLIDEYDKPILDSLDSPDVARANRDFLRGLYAVIKVCDANIRFSFITGVSKFSKVSLFSGLNNLLDITIDPVYSSICGYTEADLETVFAAELEGLDRDEIRTWYNGYAWLGSEKVYNPFDILLLLRSRVFAPHWFRTGTPTFLIDLLVRRRVNSFELDGMTASDELLSSFDVDQISPAALLFQTGYLTITGTQRRGGRMNYRLEFPNLEVRQGLNRSLLAHLVGSAELRDSHSDRLYDLLESDDFDGLRELFQSFYASIPYEWFTNNNIANYEGFYATVFYSYFAVQEFHVAVEDSTNHGRVDMVLRFQQRVYLFEFKVVEQAGEGTAMTQLRARAYADKYRAESDDVRLVAVEFSSATRNIVAFEVEAA